MVTGWLNNRLSDEFEQLTVTSFDTRIRIPTYYALGCHTFQGYFEAVNKGKKFAVNKKFSYRQSAAIFCRRSQFVIAFCHFMNECRRFMSYKVSFSKFGIRFLAVRPTISDNVSMYLIWLHCRNLDSCNNNYWCLFHQDDQCRDKHDFSSRFIKRWVSVSINLLFSRSKFFVSSWLRY